MFRYRTALVILVGAILIIATQATFALTRDCESMEAGSGKTLCEQVVKNQESQQQKKQEVTAENSVQKPIKTGECELSYQPNSQWNPVFAKFSYEVYSIFISSSAVNIKNDCGGVARNKVPGTSIKLDFSSIKKQFQADTTYQCPLGFAENTLPKINYDLQYRNPTQGAHKKNVDTLNEKAKHKTVIYLVDCQRFIGASSRPDTLFEGDGATTESIKKNLDTKNHEYEVSECKRVAAGTLFSTANNAPKCVEKRKEIDALQKRYDEMRRVEKSEKNSYPIQSVCLYVPKDKKISPDSSVEACEALKKQCAEYSLEAENIVCKKKNDAIDETKPTKNISCGDGSEKQGDKCVCKDKNKELIEKEGVYTCKPKKFVEPPKDKEKCKEADGYVWDVSSSKCLTKTEFQDQCKKKGGEIDSNGSCAVNTCKEGSLFNTKECEARLCEQKGGKLVGGKCVPSVQAPQQKQQSCAANGGQWIGNADGYCMFRPQQNQNQNNANKTQQCPQGQEMIQGKCFPKKPNVQQPQAQNKQQGGGQQRPPMPPPYMNPYMNQMTQSPFLNALTGQYVCGLFEVSDGYTNQSLVLGNTIKVKWDIATATGARPSTVTLKVSPTAKIKYNQSQRIAEITPQKTGAHTIAIDMANVQKGESCPDISVDVSEEATEEQPYESESGSSAETTPSASYPTETTPRASPTQRQQTYSGPVAESMSEATKAYGSSTIVDTSRVATYQSSNDTGNLCEVFSIGCPEGSSRSYQQNMLVEESLRNPIGTSEETPTDVLVIGGNTKTGDGTDGIPESTETHVTKAYFVDEAGRTSEEVGFAASKTSGSDTSDSYLSGFFGSAASDRVASSEETIAIDEKGQVFPVVTEEQGILSRFWNWIKSWFIWG